jgi:small subunit ribosomal protein S21
MAYEKILRGNTVHVKNDNVDQALRKFKKRVQDSGLLQELRNREHYEKPTSVRKRKSSAAKQRWRKRIQNEQLPKKLY